MTYQAHGSQPLVCERPCILASKPHDESDRYTDHRDNRDGNDNRIIFPSAIVPQVHRCRWWTEDGNNRCMQQFIHGMKAAQKNL